MNVAERPIVQPNTCQVINRTGSIIIVTLNATYIAVQQANVENVRIARATKLKRQVVVYYLGRVACSLYIR